MACGTLPGSWNNGCARKQKVAVRQPRSDIGVKRPQKKRPGASEVVSDNGVDGQPPAKRQKTKSVPKPHTTVTKKAPKKSKKSQLPPTSNEFIDSDSDVNTASALPVI